MLNRNNSKIWNAKIQKSAICDDSYLLKGGVSVN